MVNYRLDLYNEQGSPTIELKNCPVMERVPISITFQIIDVRQPDKGVGSASKTILIPGTQEVHKFFESIYDPNVNRVKYNPALKIKAFYYVKERLQFNGALQIVKIRIDELTRKVIYECQILGDVLSIMTDIKDKYLTGNSNPADDLDFSDYDHELTFADITASWTNNCKVLGTPTALANGQGYVYPFANWGTNSSNLSIMRPKDFRASLFKREILLKIFQKAGYTWTSTFLDSTAFKRRTQPPTEIPKLLQSTLNDSKFLAEADGTQLPFNTAPGYNPYSNFVPFGSQTINAVEFQNEIYDAGGIYITPVLIVPTTAKYNVQGSLGLKFVITRDTGSGPIDVSANMSSNQSSGVHIIIYNSTQSVIAGTYDLDILGGTFGLSGNLFNGSVQLNNIQLTAGDVYYIAIKVANAVLNYTAATTGATWNLETHVITGSNFSAELASSDVYEGAPIACNDLLPTLYKQSDFITDLRKEYNLYFLQDKTNPKNFFIERRPSFYSNVAADIQNWDKKHDRASGVEEFPMGELNFIDLICQHSEDQDAYNKLAFDEFKEPYGTYKKTLINDFVKGENKIQPTIAATPYAVDPGSGLVVPTIIKMENNIISTIKSKPRSWHWSGVINLPIGLSWKFLYNNDANSVTYNTIPHAGHTDNPWNPTLDLSWGVPKRHYYSIPNMNWTTNNLYNSGYSQYINEITDPNSKIIRTRFYLNPKDIEEFDFRKPISTYIDRNHIVALVNKIEDYNPHVDDSVIVELLKLTKFDPFEASVIAVDTGNGNPTDSWQKVKNNNIINSPNSFNYGNDSMITGGKENFIALNSNAQLIGCEKVVVYGNVVGFTGIGIIGPKNIDSSYNNMTLNGSDDDITLTSDTVLTVAYHNKTVYLDSSGGAFTLTWDCSKMAGIKINFIKKDTSANKIFLTDVGLIGTETFIGNSLPYDLALSRFDALPLTSKSDIIYVAK